MVSTVLTSSSTRKIGKELKVLEELDEFFSTQKFLGSIFLFLFLSFFPISRLKQFLVFTSEKFQQLKKKTTWDVQVLVLPFSAQELEIERLESRLIQSIHQSLSANVSRSIKARFNLMASWRKTDYSINNGKNKKEKWWTKRRHQLESH